MRCANPRRAYARHSPCHRNIPECAQFRPAYLDFQAKESRSRL
nr:MAG TPA: hypothetical protein [Caudoviricetes sp.]